MSSQSFSAVCQFIVVLNKFNYHKGHRLRGDREFWKQVGKDSDIDLINIDGPKDYGGVEIHETMDAPEETKTYEDLDN